MKFTCATAAVFACLVMSPSSIGARHASPAETAITSFAGGASAAASFAAITQQLANPAGLRSAALKYVGSSSGTVHFAALYALSLTAAPGRADDMLFSLLGSSSINDQILSASGLASSGDKRGLPALIDLLDNNSWLSYRDPPEHAWQLARVALLELTLQDFGLSKATTLRAAMKSQAAWKHWWSLQGGSLRWDPGQRRYLGDTDSRVLQAILPYAYSAQWPEKTAQNSVAASSDGSQVTITVPVDIMGGKPVYWIAGQGTPNAKDQTGMWRRAAEKAWNDAFNRFHYHPACPGGTPTKNGIHLHLKFDIRNAPLGSTGRPNAHKVFFNPDPMFRSYVTFSHREGSDTTSPYNDEESGTWGPEEGWTIAHEVGHLMGLGDDYTDTGENGKSVPNAGREGTMMGDENGRIDRQLINRLGKILERAGLIPPGSGCMPPKPLKGWNGDIHFETKGGGSGVEDDSGNTATWSEDDSADVQIRGSRAFVTAKITYSYTNTRLDICHPPSYYSEQVEQGGSGREPFHVDRISVSIGEPFLRGTEAIKAVCEGQTVQDRTLPVPNDANPVNGYSDGAGFGLPRGQPHGGVYAGTITRPWGKHSSNPFDIGPTCFAAQFDSDGHLIGTCTVTITWHFSKHR